MKLNDGESRLDFVKGMAKSAFSGLPKRGRLVVSIERIQEDPDNERKTFRNMDDMVESIRLHGIIEPITVTQDGDHYRILTGHRRFRAAKAVGLAELEVLVRDPDDGSTRRFKSLISNIQRENIGAVDLAETLRAMLDANTVLTQRELARQIGKSAQWVSGMMRILELPSRVQEQLRNPIAGVGYEMIQRIAQVQDGDLQQELVKAALEGESTRSIRHRIDTHRSSDDKPKSKSRPKPNSAIVQLTHRSGSCIATVKARREPQAREEMLTALRLLEQQVREYDSLN